MFKKVTRSELGDAYIKANSKTSKGRNEILKAVSNEKSRKVCISCEHEDYINYKDIDNICG